MHVFYILNLMSTCRVPMEKNETAIAYIKTKTNHSSLIQHPSNTNSLIDYQNRYKFYDAIIISAFHLVGCSHTRLTKITYVSSQNHFKIIPKHIIN